MQIWKYSLLVRDRQTIEMPRGARVLSVQMQMGDPMLWALVDPGRPIEDRHFAVVGTGHRIAFDPANYVGTIQEQGLLVWHVFELRG